MFLFIILSVDFLNIELNKSSNNLIIINLKTWQFKNIIFLSHKRLYYLYPICTKPTAHNIVWLSVLTAHLNIKVSLVNVMPFIEKISG